MASVGHEELARQAYLRILQLEALARVWQFVRGPHVARPVFFRDDKHLDFAQSNVFVLLLSMLYSMFDKSGLDLRRMQPEDDDLAAGLVALAKQWASISKPITKVRHNFGFHASSSVKGTESATEALAALGGDGLVTALGIVEGLFKLAPQIRAEAKLTYRIPPILRSLFAELVQHFEAAQQALRETFTRLDEDCTEPFGRARVALLAARSAHERIFTDLPGLVAVEERQFLVHFDDWLTQLDQLEKSIEGLAGLSDRRRSQVILQS